ncbi:MAG: HEAT repeat domain-containing protein [Spirochaetaceae bacterium]
MPTFGALFLATLTLAAGIAPPAALTQDHHDEEDDWIRLESALSGRSPQEQAEVHIILTQATSSTRSMQSTALRRIEQLVEKNDPVSRFPEITEIISLLVLEPYRVSRSGLSRNGGSGGTYPDIRVRATQLLGRIGGREAYTVLVELMRLETDGSVRIAALHALPRVDVRPEPTLPGVLARIIRRARDDPPTLRAALGTVRALHSRYGFLDTPELFTAVIDVAQGPYPRSLRTEAFEVVDLLRE